MKYIPAVLTLESYIPDQLKPGMLFLAVLYEGTEREFRQLWKFSKSTLSLEEHVQLYGYPVKPVIQWNDFFIEERNIGWLDEGEDDQDMQLLSLKDMNDILNNYDGELEILVDEEGLPHLIDDRIVVRILQEEE